MITVDTHSISLDELSLARISGFACNRAWAYICFFSISLFHIPEAMPGAVEANVYLWSAGALAVTLAIIGGLRRAFERLFAKSYGIFVGPGFMIAGSALLPVMALAAPGSWQAFALMLSSSVLTGVGSALLLVCWGLSFAKLPLNRLVTESCFSYFLGVVMYALLAATPSAAQYAFAVVLPFVSAWLCRNADARVEVGGYRSFRKQENLRSVARVAVGVLLFGFVAGITRDIRPGHMAGSSDGYAITVLIATSLIIIVFLVATNKRQTLDINLLFRPTLVAMIGGILLLPLFGNSSFAPAALVKTGYTCFELILWIIMGHLCYVQKLSPVSTFGFGRSLIAASGVLGSMVAYGLLPSLFDEPMAMVALCSVLALSLVALCNTVLTTENFSKLWAVPETERRATFRERCDTVFAQFGLTPRQVEIAYMISCGHDAGYIGEKLCISPGTINAHRMRIYKKMDIHSRQELLNLIAQGDAEDLGSLVGFGEG
ncbi:MAG: helix-turn-helix transcriptional regulator [Eggerthellaceae bacterium]|nr:helix-turn-helix transcriptional regulator [Eggerthellaceae bacterium]